MKNENFKLVKTGLLILLGLSVLINVGNNVIPTRYQFNPEIWGTVSDWMIIFITLVTAVFLYKTLRSQQEQITIQKDEIERNSRDVEFNRILDLIYRQLEISNKKYREVVHHPNAPKVPINKIAETFPHISSYNWLFRLYLKDLEFIDNFLNKTTLKQEDKNLLVSIFINNIENNVKALFGQFSLHSKVSSFSIDAREEYRKYLDLTGAYDVANLDLKARDMQKHLDIYDQLVINTDQIIAIHTKYAVKA